MTRIERIIELAQLLPADANHDQWLGEVEDGLSQLVEFYTRPYPPETTS